MMFSWNIAKSAEAIISGFALKRLFKFLLKKKIGQLIHGDIDLEQLDVQLAAGTLQLTDLALNVNFLNQKLAQQSIFRVREGSIQSLLVKMPWYGVGCEVEVDELELVVSPCCNERLHKVAGIHEPTEASCIKHVLGKDEHDTLHKSSTASGSVHEGVKTVAKMVKWLLTSFHIKIKNVIVAYDACIEKKVEKEGSPQTLVLRIKEIECGTCSSEDTNSINGAKAEDFLGISHLTNFLKFEGATIELLQINGDYTSGCFPPNASTPLLTGERDGFSGSLKLSIPWKNGSLDIRKLDAEVNVNPLTAKLQPSSLKWILVTWEMLQKCENEKVDDANHIASDTVFSSFTSYSCSSDLPSAVPSDGKLRQVENSVDFSVPLSEATMSDLALEELSLISDWVPFSAGKCQNEGIDDADLGASVDQFFECFDGMRSSQSMLGSSGMWGWTSSVFSAISAASNLASGSLDIAAEQQHVQTNLKISFVGVSVILSFHDEAQLTQHGPASVQVDTGLDTHHLGLRWKDILIVVQVSPQEWKLEATVKRIVLDDYLSWKEGSTDFGLHDLGKDASSQTLMIRALQDKVQSALPSSSLFAEASNVEVFDESNVMKTPFSLFSVEDCAYRNNVVKATVFQTYDAGHCMFAVSSKSSNGCFTGQGSFSLKLPPFIFWLNYDLVRLVSDLSRELGNSTGKIGVETDCSSETFEEKHDSSASYDVIWSSHGHTTSTSRKGGLQGNIFLPHARVILCFPFKKGGGFRSHSSCDQFIALEFSSHPNFKKLNAEVSTLVQEEAFWKKDSASTSHSVHLNVANLDVYHITRAAEENCGSFAELSRLRYCAHKVLTLGSGVHWIPLISMIWHINAVTGAWIMKSAKLLAMSDDPSIKVSSPSGSEFASVSTKKDVEDIYSEKQKEMILSSKFCLHVCLSNIVVTLCRSQYLRLFHLLNEVIDAFLNIGTDTACANEKRLVSQTSIFLECGPLEVLIELEQDDCLRSSLQRELPGSWHKLRLEIQNLWLLSVSDIGAVSGASLLWISHCEGKLWGSINTVADHDLLMGSCSNSSSGRGDGEGSNVLSRRPAGSDFVHLWDPESVHDFMSITVKCVTIVAPGGRLDWMDEISSFFSLPPPEIGQAADSNSQKGDSHRASFVLKFIDAAVSYEPYSGKSECLCSKSGNSVGFNEKPSDPYIACLLAASSLTLSNTTSDTSKNYYCIRFQDVGFLLHAVSRLDNIITDYSVNNLRKLGYVKVADEALVNASLRVNCESDISWELNCSECHVVLNTCHDTAFGLIHLASQIQQLLAPDMEESIIHLQNRWNSLQQAQERDGSKEQERSSNCSPGISQVQQLSPDSKGKSGSLGLMDEICEDAFRLCGKGARSFDGSGLDFTVDRAIQNEGSSSSDACNENVLEGHQILNIQKAELVEGYCLSDLKSLSELTINNHFREDLSKSNSVCMENGDIQRGNCGWYARTCLSIMEDYVSNNIDPSCSKQLVKGKQKMEECNNSKRCKGCLLLKNIAVKWRMFAGSDWLELGETAQHSGDICGRDGTVCLELALSNMNIQYDIFPDGDICVSKLCVSIQDFSLYDESRYAPWKLVLGYYHSKERPRESSSKAVKLNLQAVRPDPRTPLEEYRLDVTFLPMTLHLHQSQLDFLIAFFGSSSQGIPQKSGSCNAIATVDNNSKGIEVADEALLPFFQKFDIGPIILRVEYSPSRVDLAALSGGKYVELVNLVPWKGIDLKLKHVHAAGVYGWSNVCETAIGEWLEDISHNQIHKLLQGLPPIRSFVAVGSGAAKLVSLPVKNYRKDNRLVKGLQRGTIAFLRSISIEALGLGVNLAAGAHEILLLAECILTHVQPSVPRPLRSKLKTSLRTDQPEDAQRGIQQAYESLSDGFGKTTSALIRSPIKAYQRGGGVGSAFVTAVRGAPAAAIAPASAAAQAVHCALLGVRNSLDPEHKEESLNKYLGPYHSQERS